MRIEAEDPGSDLGTTTFHGVELGGLLPQPRRPWGLPGLPGAGSTSSVTDSTFDGVLVGTPLAELAAAKVVIARNRYRSTIAVEVIDADRSEIGVLANRWAVSYRGVQVRQNLDGDPSLASEIRVDANRGRVAPLFAGFGDGLSFEDPAGAASPDRGVTALRVTRNRFELGNGDEAVASGITASGAARLRLAGNRLSGTAGAGLEVDATSGCRVLGNSMAGARHRRGPRPPPRPRHQRLPGDRLSRRRRGRRRLG